MPSGISRSVRALDKGVSYLRKGIFAKTPILAYVSGFLGKQNLGDEALYQAAELLFHRLQVIHFDGSRSLKFVSSKFPLHKAGIMAGGTLINRIPEWYQAASEFCDSPSELYIFGTGVAHSTFWSHRPGYVDMMSQWKALLEKCAYVGVRGPLSAELLKDAGVKGVEVVGDPALAFAGEQVSRDYAPKSIGINFGRAKGDLWGDESSVYTEFVKLAKLAKAANWSVKWFVVWPTDLDITERAAKESGTGDHIIAEYENTRRFISEVRQMSTFAGMKLHATLLATCAYVPSVMVEYQPKCRDYMKSIGQESATVRTDEFKGEKVWEMVLANEAEREKRAIALFNGMQPLCQFQRQKAEMIMQEICNL